MHSRVEEHAEILLDHSLGVAEGDNVVISASPEARDLVTALYQGLGERGAQPTAVMRDAEARRAYFKAIDEEDIAESVHVREMTDAADAYIGIRGGANPNMMSDIDPEIQSTYSAVNKEARELRLSKPWVLTQHPTHGHAQQADMPTPAYAEFVYEAITKDWGEQRVFQEQLVEILEDGSEVRIQSGDETDLTMHIDGMHAVNDYGENNMPGGEVFTAPVKTSVEGTVLFDKPLIARGREVTDVRLTFEDGKVTTHSASKNEDVIASILDADEGAQYLGELGIGMNRDIDTFTYNMLFDEKMGDTVHMALGRAYGDTVGDDREQNDSSMHLDMIVDMSEDAVIEVDGEVVQENGTFVFEDED